MRYLALAADYDGTLAHHGTVDETTIEALRRLKQSGRKLILVTGRELPDLERVFSHLGLFDRVVAENGGLLYRPDTGEARSLGEAPKAEFLEALRQKSVQPVSVGKVIVATWEPHETAVLAAIHETGLELQVIFNKGAVMVLPSGINKATGLKAALHELGLSRHNVVSVGDAENDHAFLECSECSVAVGNALPALKQRADFTTTATHGQGVTELIERILRDDLKELEPKLSRHDLTLGSREDGREARLHPYGVNVLIAGSSGGGKSTLVTAFYEQLCTHGYQVCIIDPEGDYTELDGAMLYGDTQRAPTLEEAGKALENPEENVVLNLVGQRLEDRPAFFQRLLPVIQDLRARTGRPHWVLVDEAHHVLPADLRSAPVVVPSELHGLLLVTVEPQSVSPVVLQQTDLLIAIGTGMDKTIRRYCGAIDVPVPALPEGPPPEGKVLGWRRREDELFYFQGVSPVTIRRRHTRKYAQGELAPDFSFYFEGPDQKLHLRAQNLQTFIQLAEGVDTGTWMHHLRRQDYSRWFRTHIKDEELAKAAERIEQSPELGPEESLKQIKEEIEDRYTAAVG